MGCTISNYRGSHAPVLVADQDVTSQQLSVYVEAAEAAMTQSKDELGPFGAVECLEVKLQRFSVGAAEPQTETTVDDDVQEDETSSSSSESSAGLPSELHPADGTRAGPTKTLAPTAPTPNDAAVGLLYDQSMEQHFGPDHIERPARIIQLYATLQEQGLMERCWRLVPRQATDEELLLCHSEAHIRKVDSMFSELYPSRPDTLADAEYCYADGRMGDVYLCTGTARAARFATGCCVQAVQSVLSGAVSRALAVVRPPGHHAECERAMGFCFFNNVAVAALVALQHTGVRRVAVLDWDVHHGNGIQQLLFQRPDALYLSLHRDPKRFYPFTSGFLNEAGKGPGTGFNVNVPWLKKGMGDGDYMAAFALVVEPVLDSYQPDLVIVAAGFDAAAGDPLGGCMLSPEGYGWMTERLMRFAGGRLVLALEGGYNNRVTSWCAAACVRALLEGRASPPLPLDKEHLWPSEAHNSLKAVYEFQRQHWAVLRARSWTEAWEAHLKDVTRMLGANARSKRTSAGHGSNGRSSVGGGADTEAPTRGADAVAAVSAEASSSRPSDGPRGAAHGTCGSGGGGARRSSSAGSTANGGDEGGGAGSGGPSLPARLQSLQEAFKARKAAREAAAAAERGAAGAAAAAAAAAAATTTAKPASAPAGGGGMSPKRAATIGGSAEGPLPAGDAAEQPTRPECMPARGAAGISAAPAAAAAAAGAAAANAAAEPATSGASACGLSTADGYGGGSVCSSRRSTQPTSGSGAAAAATSDSCSTVIAAAAGATTSIGEGGGGGGGVVATSIGA